MNHHIGFIGGGNMAQAIITGLLKSGRAASDILVSDPNPESRRAISALGVAAFDHHEPVMAQAEFMILAVKPQMMDAVLAEIAPSLRESQIVISIAAGITIGGIRRRLNAPKKLWSVSCRTRPHSSVKECRHWLQTPRSTMKRKSRCNASLNRVGRLFGYQVKMPSIQSQRCQDQDLLTSF